MPANTPRGYTYPLYSDIQNFPTQIQDLAQDIDADVQSLYDAVDHALNYPSARVSTNNQVIPSNADTTLVWTNELYDNAAMVNLGGAPTLITVTEVGIYLISAWTELAANGNATVAAAQLRVNSSAVLAPNPVGCSRYLDQTEPTGIHVATLHYVPALPETLTVSIRHNSPAAVTAFETQFSVTKISA